MVTYACLSEGRRALYVTGLTCVKIRILFCKLRVSDHELEVENGRHCGIPRSERLCKHCGVVEDEAHFLLNCALYDDIRTERDDGFSAIDQNYSSYSNIEKVQYMLNGNTDKILLLTSNFLSKATEIRNDYLEILNLLIEGL